MNRSVSTSSLAPRKAKKHAIRLARDVERMLKKHRSQLSDKARERLEKAIRDVREAVEAERSVEASTRALEREAESSLGFAKKGTTREYAESLIVAVVIALFLRAFVLEAFKIPTGSMIPTLLVGDHIFVNKFVYGLRIPFSNQWLVEWNDPQRGEVIVFRNPREPSQDFIKRVVAVAGDEVRVEGRDVYVNGEKLPRIETDPVRYLEENEGGPMNGSHQADAYLERPAQADSSYTVLYEDMRFRRSWPEDTELPGLDCAPPEMPEPRTCVVEEDWVFVMGDNRDHSSDSREWGGVPREMVKGRAMFVWCSWGPRSGPRWSRFGRGVH